MEKEQTTIKLGAIIFGLTIIFSGIFLGLSIFVSKFGIQLSEDFRAYLSAAVFIGIGIIFIVGAVISTINKAITKKKSV